MKTDFKLCNERRDADLYSDYISLVSNPDNSKGKIVQRLMKKYRIHAPSTIYAIIKRERERMEKGE